MNCAENRQGDLSGHLATSTNGLLCSAPLSPARGSSVRGGTELADLRPASRRERSFDQLDPDGLVACDAAADARSDRPRADDVDEPADQAGGRTVAGIADRAVVPVDVGAVGCPDCGAGRVRADAELEEREARDPVPLVV